MISIAIVSGGYIWYYYGVDIYTLRLDYQREKWNLIDYPLKESLEVLLQSEKRDKTEKGKKVTNTAKKKGKAEKGENHEHKNQDVGSVENVKTDKSIVG